MSRNPVLDEVKLTSDIERALGGQSLTLKYLQVCDSTNKQCLQMAKHNSVVVAEKQEQGRGRRGKVWLSPASRNIYCSVGVHKKLAPTHLGLISLLVGTCIAQVLDELGFNEIALKWPNDILLQGKKLGGILIETQMISEHEYFLVVGFGINVHLPQDALNQIDQAAISLSQFSELEVNRQHLLALVIARIINSINHFKQDCAQDVLQKFSFYDSFVGEQILVKTQSETLPGTYLGLEPSGNVRILTDRGEQIFASAEISLRKNNHATA